MGVPMQVSFKKLTLLSSNPVSHRILSTERTTKAKGGAKKGRKETRTKEGGAKATTNGRPDP